MTLFTRFSDGRPLTVPALLLTLLTALLSGCGLDKTSPEPTFGGPELYPLEVGTYRIYAVQDTTWQVRRPTASSFQFREVVTEAFNNAESTPQRPARSYRVVRARRPNASQPWVEDSVFVLTPLPNALLLSRSNVRTIELLFPVRAGRRWNRFAFDVRELGSGSGQSDSLNREYRRPGEPLSLTLPGGLSRRYEQTVRTYDNDEDDAYYLATQEQVYAPGEGLVLRRRRRFFFTDGNGASLPETGVYSGFSRREMLLERGRL